MRARAGGWQTFVKRGLGRTAALALVFGALVACDRAGATEDCTSTADPAATSGARIDTCKPSTFKITDTRWRAVTGKLWAGESPVPAAFVRVDPTPLFGADRFVPASTLATDTGGVYGPIADAPMHYDVSAVFGSTIAITRGLSFRYFEPTVDAPFPPRAAGALDLTPTVDGSFAVPLDVDLAAPVPDGMSVAFFAKGDDALYVAGDLATGIRLVSTAFTSHATIHALVYPTGGELADAQFYATGPVDATVGRRAVVKLAFASIADPLHTADWTRTPSLQVTAPEGFTKASIDLLVAYSRTSRAYVTSLAVGQARRIPVFPDSLYTAYRIVATAPDGRSADSGIVPFDLADVTNVHLETAVPATVLGPADGATLGADEAFVAEGTGTFELTLAPRGEGPTLHVLTTDRTIPLPDFAKLGREAHGAYTWTITSFPNAVRPESVSGRDARRGQLSARTAPRTVVLP